MVGHRVAYEVGHRVAYEVGHAVIAVIHAKNQFKSHSLYTKWQGVTCSFLDFSNVWQAILHSWTKLSFFICNKKSRKPFQLETFVQILLFYNQPRKEDEKLD